FVRLNGKRIASLSRGTAFSSERFLVTSRDLTRSLGGSSESRRFLRFRQFNEQAWSVHEYLWGEPASEERRAGFRTSVKDGRSKPHQGPSFQLQWGKVGCKGGGRGREIRDRAMTSC